MSRPLKIWGQSKNSFTFGLCLSVLTRRLRFNSTPSLNRSLPKTSSLFTLAQINFPLVLLRFTNTH